MIKNQGPVEAAESDSAVFNKDTVGREETDVAHRQSQGLKEDGYARYKTRSCHRQLQGQEGQDQQEFR